MNASFFKRLCAYFIDMIVIGVIVGIITVNYSNSKVDDYRKELNNVTNDYINNGIDESIYMNRYQDIIYNMEKSSVNSNIVYLVVCIGYFIVFQYLNNGQSIGKKVMKIRVVRDDKRNISIKDIVIRTFIVNEIGIYIISLILVMLFNKKDFFIGYGITNLIGNVLIFISSVMIINRSDRKAIRDIITKTSVIDENI